MQTGHVKLSKERKNTNLCLIIDSHKSSLSGDGDREREESGGVTRVGVVGTDISNKG